LSVRHKHHPKNRRVSAPLRLADRSDPIVAIVAQKIIALAKAGESNPDRLCEQALMDVRNSQFSIAPPASGH
jgi:hypothetical protein